MPTFNIDSVDSTGKAIAHSDGMVVFVDKGIPGQKIEGEIIKKKKTYMEVKSLQVIEESPDAVEAPCAWFGSCGGCVWQNLAYEKQLEYKQKIVCDALERIGKLDVKKIVLPIKPSQSPWYYRNRVDLSFGLNDAGETDLGFRRKGSFTGVLPVDQCHIFSEKFPEIIAAVRTWTRETRMDYFDLKKSPVGFFQYCIMRRSEAEGSWMFHFITRKGPFPFLARLTVLLDEAMGGTPYSIFHTQNMGGSSCSDRVAQKTKCLCGKGALTEKLGGLHFSLSPFSFFQTNTKGAEVLYDAVTEFLDVKKGMKILDLYCGTGTIGQYVAVGKKVELIGIDIVPDAIEDAKENAEQNGVSAEYFCGNAEIVLQVQADKLQNVDGVLVDPPRAGLTNQALMSVIEIGASKVIYVSCNPATFARDMLFIHEHSKYKVKNIQPVDMFPQTAHVELVAEFELK